MAYMTNDGELIPHNDPTQVLEYLWQTTFDPEDTLDAYLTGLRHRSKMQTGKAFTAPNSDHAGIVRELCAAGLISPVKAN